ncbi:MAG: phosphoribosylformylglycinamidine synthase subunit PurL [Actinomycetota bacterium]
MTDQWALVVGPGHRHDTDSSLLAAASLFGIDVAAITEHRLVHLRGTLDGDQLTRLADTLLIDPVGGWWKPAADLRHDAATVVETGLRPGVTDREGTELVRAAGQLGLDLDAATIGRRWVIEAGAAGGLDDATVAALAQRVLHNEVIERWSLDALPPGFVSDQPETPPTTIETVIGVDDDALLAISSRRRLGMNLVEMQAVRSHFADLGRDPTDAEMETIAQTWSEHCAHKTFRAAITVTDGEGNDLHQVDGLLKSYLRKATDTVDAPWVRSAFVDNAGIVAFDDEHDIALKAETHNHPSALEPFGGANTGVGGVVRDIIGVSAKPIAITDILCFGPSDLDPADLPDGVLHPRRIRDGVIAGIGDYGNKIGVPNVGGAIVYDPAYTTTPLVFAGCVGILPTGSHPTEPQPGDSIVVLGGAVGRDGVGGATFSSQTMQAETAEVAGSSVQIGDPIVEKGLIDVVMDARDAGLYTAITDCGAGGLSSSIGEMASELGADVDLDLVPRKYPGLAGWETWLSEAQERMVLAAPDPVPILALAHRWGIDGSVVGTFTGDGVLRVRQGDEAIVLIDCHFLHEGCPRHELTAVAQTTDAIDRADVAVDVEATTLALLAHPTVASKEATVRTYDHEIMGGTLVRPYGGAEGDGAGDGAATIPPGTSGDRAMVIGIGVNAVIGNHDAYAMAWHVVDEAVRNAVIAGADPAELSLLDNFAWGNPNDPETLGGLEAACRGCHDAALAFGAPFVSGKDSLYNVFVHPDGTADPVAPTLVLTAVGIAKSPEHIPVTGVLTPGDQVWLVGPAEGALRGSHLDLVLGADHGGSVPAPDPAAVDRHHQMAAAIASGLVVSAHDPAEGGLAVAAAEWALAGRLGLDLNLPPEPAVLFGEGPGRYLVEVAPEHADAFGAAVPSARRIGQVIEGDAVRIGDTTLTLPDIERAWKSP